MPAKIRPEEPGKLFLGYQRRWIGDKSRLKFMEKARQIGISWATAYAAVERATPSEARFDQWVSSRDELQARLFLTDCKFFAGVLGTAADALGLKVVDERKNAAFVMEFASGRRIHSLSSNPDAQAGKRGSRILDEFALHRDPRLLYSIAQPGITWGGQLEIISTHRGSYNYFNELAEEILHKENPKGFSHHRVTLEDALNQGLLWALQRKLPKNDPRADMDEAEFFSFIRAECASEEQFLQEFMCIPADDNAAFLSYDLIAACEYLHDENWEMNDADLEAAQGREFFLGVDVGRSKDLTVFWLLERSAGIMLTRRVEVLQGLPFSQQESALHVLLDNRAIRRVCIDSTGLGMQFAERAQERYGAYRVEPVRFSGPVKEELAYPVRSIFEDRAIRLPQNNKIRADLRAVRKTTTAAGNIRFEAERGEDGHADRFWALALALHAGSDSVGGSGQMSASNPRKSRGLLKGFA